MNEYKDYSLTNEDIAKLKGLLEVIDKDNLVFGQTKELIEESYSNTTSETGVDIDKKNNTADFQFIKK